MAGIAERSEASKKLINAVEVLPGAYPDTDFVLREGSSGVMRVDPVIACLSPSELSIL